MTRRLTAASCAGPSAAVGLLSDQVENFVPSEELSQLLASYDLRPHFDAACVALGAAPEFGRAADTATEENLNGCGRRWRGH